MDRYSINNHGPSKRIQVIDNETGKVLKSWSYKAFEGEGVTQNRRIKNANAVKSCSNNSCTNISTPGFCLT